MLRRVLSVLLSAALFCALFSGVMAQVADVSTEVQSGFNLSSEDGLDASLQLELEESKYIDKFIIKYSDPKVEKKIENATKNSFVASKVKKEAKRNEVAKSDVVKFRLSQKELKDNKQSKDLKEACSDISIKEWRGSYKIIELKDAIEPLEFVDKMKAEMGDDLEFIQPDYKLELSNADLVTLNLDLGGYLPQAPQATSMPEATPLPQVVQAPQSTPGTQINSANLLNSVDADMQAAWTVSTGMGITVAVIDTGIDVTHPDLANRVVYGYDFINDTAEIYNPELGMQQLHGTHIAGIIAKTAPNAQIMPLKCFENGRAYTSDIIDAIHYAEQNGAKIMNCSWGSSDNNHALKEAMQNSGMMFVTAAGNNRTNIDEAPIYPAAFELDNILSVGSLNSDLGYSYYSNYGISNVDIAVQGRDISSTIPGGGYGTMSGTSISAGYVSGAAALVSALGETSIQARLKNTAYRLSNLQNKVNNSDKLGLYNAVSNTIVNDIAQVYPEDDFDVYTYQPPQDGTWELFSDSDFAFDPVTGTIIGYTGLGGDVVIPSSINGTSVTKIGVYAFDYNCDITSVVIPESIIEIQAGAFNQCYSLVNITLSEGLEIIGSGAFSETLISSLYIPSTVTSIGYNGNGGICERYAIELSAFEVDEGNLYYSSYDGILYNKAQTAIIEVPAACGAVRIPDTITSIPSGKFYERFVTEIVLPSNLTHIGEDAFIYCRLTKVTIPASVTTIEDEAFAWNPLEAVYFEGDAPYNFGTDVFDYCDPSFKLYYYPDSSGFTSPAWNGYPSVIFDDNTLKSLNYGFIGQTLPIALVADDVNNSLQENRYDITLPYAAKGLPANQLPNMVAIPTMTGAEVDITQITSFPGTAKIAVTSVNGSTRNYYVHFKYDAGNVVGSVTNKVGSSTYKAFSDLRPLSLAELRELYLESGSNWENNCRAYIDRGLTATGGVSTTPNVSKIPTSGLITPEPEYINSWIDLGQQWFVMWMGNRTKNGGTSSFFHGASWIATGNNDRATDYMKTSNNDAITFTIDRGATIWVATKGGQSTNFNNNEWVYNTNSGYAIRHGDGDSFTAFYTKHFDAGTVNIPTYGGNGAGSRMYMPIIVWDAPGTGDTSLSSLTVEYNGSNHNISIVPGQTTYNVKVGSVPTVSATLTDSNANMVTTQTTELPGSATISVASGSNVTTYTINFTAFGHDIVYADREDATGKSGIAYVKNILSTPIAPSVENISDPNLMNAGTTFWNFGDGNGDVNISRAYTNYGGAIPYLRNEGMGGGSSQSVYVKMDLSSLDTNRSVQQAVLSTNLTGGNIMNYNGTNKSLYVEVYEVPETKWITGTGTHDAAWSGLAPNMIIGTNLALFPLANKSNAIVLGDVSAPYMLTWMGAPDNTASIIPAIQSSAYEKKLTTVYVGQMAVDADYGTVSADVTQSVRDKLAAGKTTATFKLKIVPYVYGYNVPANTKNDMFIKVDTASEKRPKLEVTSTEGGAYANGEKKLAYITIGDKSYYTSGNRTYEPGKTPIDLSNGFNPDLSGNQVINLTFADLVDGKVYLNAYAKDANATVSINGGVSRNDNQLAQLIPTQGVATAQVIVTASNGESMTYSLTFNLTDYIKSNDASLKSLSYTHPELGKQDITIEQGKFEYNIELPYGISADLPQIAVEKNHYYATIQSVVQAVQIPGDATVTVIAEDGTEVVYMVCFTKSYTPTLEGIGTVTNLKYRGAPASGDFKAVNGMQATAPINIYGNGTYPTQADKIAAAGDPQINLYKNNSFRLYSDRNSETGGGNGSSAGAAIGSQMEFTYLNTTSSRFLDERVTRILTMNNEKSNTDSIPDAYSFTIDKPATIYIAAPSRTLSNIINNGWILDNVGLSVSRASVSGLQYTQGDNLYYAIPNGGISTYNGVYTKHYAAGANVQIPSAGATLSSGMVVLIIWDTASTVTQAITQLSLDAPENLSQTYGSTGTVSFTALPVPYYGVDYSTIEWYVNDVKQTETGLTFSYLPGNAGEYVVSAKISDNVSISGDSKTITVAKADPDITWPAPNLTYSPDLTLEDIELDEGFVWMEPTTSLNAPGGSFAVIYTPSNLNNYNVLSRDIMVVVNKVTPDITAPVLEPVTFTPTLKLSDIPLGEGFSWILPNTNLTIPGGRYQAVYMPEDTVNYYILTFEIDIIVNEPITTVESGFTVVELDTSVLTPYFDGINYARFDIVNLSGASQNKALLAKGKSSNDSKFIDPSLITVPPLYSKFNVEIAGEYSIWLRVKAENTGQDSFWYSVDDAPLAVFWLTPKAEEWQWISISANLTSGVHTLNLCPRENNLVLDKMIISRGFNYVPSDMFINEHAVLEAESGENNNNIAYFKFDAKNDITASGGKAYAARYGQTGSFENITETYPGAILKFNVNTEKQGTYSVWVRAKCENNNQDNIWAKLGDNPYVKYQLAVNDENSQGQWKWTKLADVNLESGVQYLQFVPCESGVLLDKLVITSNASYVPEDSMLNGHAVFEIEESTITPYIDGDLVVSYETISDPNASNGAYLVASRIPDGASNLESVESNATPVIKYHIDADKLAMYNIVVRAAINNQYENSLWLAIDDFPYKEIQINNYNTPNTQNQFNITNIERVMLTPGPHTVKIIPKSWNGKFDKLIISRQDYYRDAKTLMVNGVMETEMENGSFLPYQIFTQSVKFTQVDSISASGGKAIRGVVQSPSSNNIVLYPTYVDPPVLQVQLDVDKSAEYAIWVRAMVKQSNQGLWHRMYDAYEKVDLPVNSAENPIEWKWTRIKVIDLLPGQQTLEIVPVASGGIYDQIIITDDLDYVPVINIEPEQPIANVSTNISITDQQEKLIVLSCNNWLSNSSSNFRFTYNKQDFEIIDIAVQDQDNIAIQAGVYRGVEVLNILDGESETNIGLRPIVDETPDKKWSGVITIIKVKALKTGTSTISFSRQY